MHYEYQFPLSHHYRFYFIFWRYTNFFFKGHKLDSNLTKDNLIYLPKLKKKKRKEKKKPTENMQCFVELECFVSLKSSV